MHGNENKRESERINVGRGRLPGHPPSIDHTTTTSFDPRLSPIHGNINLEWTYESESTKGVYLSPDSNPWLVGLKFKNYMYFESQFPKIVDRKQPNWDADLADRFAI